MSKKKEPRKPRIPVAPPGWRHKSKKDYDRKRLKKETEKEKQDANTTDSKQQD